MMRNKKVIYPAISMMVIFLGLCRISWGASATEYNRQEMIEKSSLCIDCHQELAAGLVGSAHQLSTNSRLKTSLAVGCIGCHDGWEKHVDDPSAENISNPGRLLLSDQAQLCGRCHLGPHQAAMVSTDPHSRANIACLSCHTIHNNQNTGLVKDETQNFCAVCHTTVAAEFKRRSVHPLESGNIQCTSCHNLSGLKDPALATGHDWSCQSCHTEKSGPFIYEHPVVEKHLINGGGCTECHEPHGSSNDRLLTQPGNGTCLQCHSIPPLHRTQHSGLGTKLDCVFCHSDIHGSFDNGKLLDPDLGTKLFPDCYRSGCHIFNY
jgi:DmsE family decaheme c-type cytochrome